MFAYDRPSRAASGGAPLRLAWLAACVLAACGADPLAPAAAPADPVAQVADGAHAILLAVPDAEPGDAAGGRASEDAVLLAVTGAAVDSVTPAAGVRAAVMPMGGTTHLLLTGRFPRGAAARVATVWTAPGAAPAVAVTQAVGAGSLRQQRAASLAATLR